MARWWTEIWSLQTDQSRIYCGIAETDEGFAVDVFSDDTCVESVTWATRGEALHAAKHVRRRYETADVLDQSFAAFLLDAPITSWEGGCSLAGMVRRS